MDGFFGQLIDTATDIVESVGTNADASSQYNAAKAELFKVKAQTAALETAAKIEARKKQMEIVQTSIALVAILAFVIVAASVLLKLKKSS